MPHLSRQANALVMRLGRRAPRALLGFVRHLPVPLVERLRGAGLRRTLRLAGSRSRFYRQKFEALGIAADRVRSLAELKDLHTTPEELRAAASEDLVCERPTVAMESSGTTGRITRVYFSHEELDYAARQAIVFLALVGIGERDRILGAFDYSWGLGGPYMQRVAAQSGLFGVCPGLIDPREAVDRLAVYGFTVVIGDPFWLARFTEVAMARGVRTRLTAMISGAERVTGGLRRELEDYWRAPLYMNYASTESGASLGVECPARQGYHLNEYDFAVEIADPDPEGYGEIVFTTLTRTVMPLIRYHTRDVARWEASACACGWPFRRLSAIRGRTDEVIACVWGDVHPEFFEALLGGIPGVGEAWQVALRQDGLRPLFEFRVEDGPGAPSAAALGADLRRRLAERHPALWAKVEQGMSALAVRLAPPGSLRTGRKLRRLVDERDAGDLPRRANERGAVQDLP
jgi:phenylacetate-CoA ligase